MATPHHDEFARLRQRLANLAEVLDVDVARARLAELSELAGQPGLWDDPERARAVTTELSRREQEVGRVDGIGATLDDLDHYATATAGKSHGNCMRIKTKMNSKFIH